MIYVWILLIFGLIPLTLLWLLAPWIVRQYKGSLLTIVVLILMVSIPWEMVSVRRVWFYAPGVTLGPRLLDLPFEELIFFVIDGLLVGSLALWLEKKFYARHR